jgi:hypothetical protein
LRYHIWVCLEGHRKNHKKPVRVACIFAETIILWLIDPLLDRDLEKDKEYIRWNAIG